MCQVSASTTYAVLETSARLVQCFFQRNQPSAYCGLNRVSRWTGRCSFFLLCSRNRQWECFFRSRFKFNFLTFLFLGLSEEFLPGFHVLCLLSNFVCVPVCVEGGLEVYNSITNLPAVLYRELQTLEKCM